MKYFKLDGPYQYYCSKDMWDENSELTCVVDAHIWANKETNPDKQILLLVEPRSIQPNVYNYVSSVAQNYKYVFTHDSILLNTLPNAKPLFWSTVWCDYNADVSEKTKLISIVSSDKEMCDLHKVRKTIARKYKDKIDVYGTIDGGKFTDPIDTLKNYKYSVVIENYIDDIWFTEKILNCFATKTIPIYYGARDICEYFNKWGMILCHDITDIDYYINKITNDPDSADNYYKSHKKDIDINYELSKKYHNFEKWFYKEYKKEFEEMFKNIGG